MPNPCPAVLGQNLRVVPLYWFFCRSPLGQANVQTRLEIIHSHKFTSTTIILSSFLPSSIEEESFFLSRLNFIKAYIYQTFFKIENPLSCNPWLHPLLPHLMPPLHTYLLQVVSLISFYSLSTKRWGFFYFRGKSSSSHNAIFLFLPPSKYKYHSIHFLNFPVTPKFSFLPMVATASCHFSPYQLSCGMPRQKRYLAFGH